MRRATLISCLSLLLLPGLALGQNLERSRGKRVDQSLVMQRFLEPQQVQSCFGCLLGIWDDPALTLQTGTLVPLTPKTIYLGIKYASPYDGLTGIEFSISGIRQAEDGILVTSVDPLVPAAIMLGSVQAPADTSATSTQTGGMNIAWPSCLTGDQALVRITILSFSPVSEKVLWVKHRYPTSNPEWRTPVFTQCDAPAYTATRVTGGCYGLNFTGTLPCATPVNNPPVCDSGGPYTPTCTSPTTTVPLDGTGSFDPDPGSTLTYQWTTDCPGATIQNPTSVHATLLLPTPPGSSTSCQVSLTVSDGIDISTCGDTVHVSCQAANQPPVCDAGGPYAPACTSPTTTVPLDGSGSFDPDSGTVLSYRWTTACPGATIQNPASAQATLLLPTPPGSNTSCQVNLTVSDGTDSSSCGAAVRVNCTGANQPPVCDAGGPYVGRCLGPQTAVLLDGTGSYDPDPGNVLTYAWSSTCPGARFDNPTSRTPTLTVDTRCCPVTCDVALVVSDGTLQSTCRTTVTLEGGGEPPAPLVLWPPNHQYVSILPTDCVRDACTGGGPTTIEVLSVRSDEAEDARGNGDGDTVNDIVIVCPFTVRLRAERQGAGDGRVYTITYAVTDNSGTRRVECKVSVPHDQSGDPAVESPGPGYQVVGSCNGGGLMPTRQPTSKDGMAKAQVNRDGEPGIVVSFSLATSGPVALDVYDIAGRLVRSVRTELAAGTHQLRWDGTDSSGRDAAQGIYVMQLRAEGQTQRTKALLMR